MIRQWIIQILVEAFQKELLAARQEGYRDGHERGYARGLDEGFDGVAAAAIYRQGYAVQGQDASYRAFVARGA